MHYRASSLIGVALAFVAVQAHAAQVSIAPPACANLAASECEAVGVLFADAYARASGTRVSPPPKQTEGGLEGTWQPTGDEYVDISALRLSSKVQIRGTLRQADGTQIHTVEMTAASLDDLPPVADRVCEALVHRVGVNDTRTLHSITRTEASRPNRTYSEKVIGFKTALIQPFAQGVTFNPMMSLQFDGRFESETYFLEFGAGLALPTGGDHRNLGALFAEFGGSLYLGQGNTSPYVGVGFSPKIMFSGADGGVRAAAYGQFGLMFMRFSSTRLYTELRLSQNIIPIDVNTGDGSFLENSPETSVRPLEAGLQLGIGW
ncbi:MAG: hypothetical protein SF187_27205 [Deltaproteobacteria bacterium]|nr:hypothetical protein [Deltaproteobacteria bacterium]